MLEAACVKDGYEIALNETKLDLIFLDLKIPHEPGCISSGENGLSLLKKICEMEKSLPVIVMTGESIRENAVEKILRAGATSFVPKTASAEMMMEAIIRAIEGGIWLPSSLDNEINNKEISVDSVLSDIPLPLTAADLGITQREFDVLRLALQGNAPWKVAKILGINASNTRQYLSKLYSKFGVIDLYGLQCHFAKSGHLLGIISSAPSRVNADRLAVSAS